MSPVSLCLEQAFVGFWMKLLHVLFASVGQGCHVPVAATSGQETTSRDCQEPGAVGTCLALLHPCCLQFSLCRSRWEDPVCRLQIGENSPANVLCCCCSPSTANKYILGQETWPPTFLSGVCKSLLLNGFENRPFHFGPLVTQLIEAHCLPLFTDATSGFDV